MSDLRSQLLLVRAALAKSRTPVVAPSPPIRSLPAQPALPATPVSSPRSRSAAPSVPVALPAKKDAPHGAILKISQLPKSALIGRNKMPVHTAARTGQSAPSKTGVPQSRVSVPIPAAPPPPGVPLQFRPLAKGLPTRRAWFKSPEPWVAAGGRTQCIEGEGRGAVDIYIGIDFGTSFTKAAVGLRDVIYPVTWEGVSECTPAWLLPSEHTVLDDGKLYIGQHPDAPISCLRADLKLPFINAGVSMASIATASEFLGQVLRYIRAWVFRHHGPKIGGASIRWYVNLGSPSNGLEQSALEAAYRRLAATSWMRSLCTDSLGLADFAAQEWRPGMPLRDLTDFDIKPEFVAQMAGYMQSPQRMSGLHALIDVGGGTLDIVTFNVHQVDKEDTFPFLVPRIHPLGTHGLLQNRLCGRPGEMGPIVVDQLKPVTSSGEFAALHGIEHAHVQLRDRLFGSEIQKMVRSVFETTRSRRYRMSAAWDSSVRTFFTGGGAPASVYKEAVSSTMVPSRYGLQLMPLPPHPKLSGFTGNSQDYQRISVACGLAQDAFTLARIVPAREVEDDRPLTMGRRATLDRDELYSK